MKHQHVLHQRNGATIAVVVCASLHGIRSRFSNPSGLMDPAVPLALFSFPGTLFPTSVAIGALHRQPWYATDEAVTSLSMMRAVSRRRRQGDGGAVDAIRDITIRELRRSSMITFRQSPSNASRRRVRSVLWGGSRRGESDEEVNDGDGNGNNKHDEQELAEDVAVDVGIKKRGLSGSDGEQKASSGRTYSEGEMNAESLSALERRNPRDPTAADDVVQNGDMSSSSFRAWLPRFFPTSSDQDRSYDEEEAGGVVKPLIELPLDGILLQLFPALLIAVLGLFLTVAVQVEAGRFDSTVGEDGGTAVVVTDLRDLGNAPQ